MGRIQFKWNVFESTNVQWDVLIIIPFTQPLGLYSSLQMMSMHGTITIRHCSSSDSQHAMTVELFNVNISLTL